MFEESRDWRNDPGETTLRLTAIQPTNLPELALIWGIQQVTIKSDESLSPSLFAFLFGFAAIHD
jgi:hypothetical protein